MALLDDVVLQLRDRAEELVPAVEEHAKITEALDNLNDAGIAPKLTFNEVREMAGLPPAPSDSAGKPTKRGPGRPKGSGKHYQSVLAVIEENPGLKSSEIGALAGLGTSNYIYRILKVARRRGEIKKAHGRWYPKA